MDNSSEDLSPTSSDYEYFFYYNNDSKQINTIFNLVLFLYNIKYIL
jgi:hypothetical protein